MQPTSVHFVLIFISVKVWILSLFDGKVQSVNIYFVFSESVFTIFIKVEGFPMLFCPQQLECLMGLSRTFKFKAFYLCFLCICLFVYLCILFSRCCLVRNVTVVINLKRLPPPTSQHFWYWNIFSFLFVKNIKMHSCTLLVEYTFQLSLNHHLCSGGWIAWFGHWQRCHPVSLGRNFRLYLLCLPAIKEYSLDCIWSPSYQGVLLKGEKTRVMDLEQLSTNEHKVKILQDQTIRQKHFVVARII